MLIWKNLIKHFEQNSKQIILCRHHQRLCIDKASSIASHWNYLSMTVKLLKDGIDICDNTWPKIEKKYYYGT